MTTSLEDSSGIGASAGMGIVFAFDSFLNFLLLLEKIEPKICILSGRSFFVEGIIPLPDDLLEDFRDSSMVSFPAETDSRDR